MNHGMHILHDTTFFAHSYVIWLTRQPHIQKENLTQGLVLLCHYIIPWFEHMQSEPYKYTLTSTMPPPVMSLFLLYPKTLGMDVVNSNLLPLRYISLPNIIVFDNKMIHQRI